MTLTIELPETVTHELSARQISSQQVRAFVVEAIEAWLRLQSNQQTEMGLQTPSRFRASAVPLLKNWSMKIANCSSGSRRVDLVVKFCESI